MTWAKLGIPFFIPSRRISLRGVSFWKSLEVLSLLEKDARTVVLSSP